MISIRKFEHCWWWLLEQGPKHSAVHSAALLFDVRLQSNINSFLYSLSQFCKIQFHFTLPAHVYILSGHSNIVASVAFSPDGTRIVSGSYDGSIKIWDSISGAEIISLSGISLFLSLFHVSFGRSECVCCCELRHSCPPLHAAIFSLVHLLSYAAFFYWPAAWSAHGRCSQTMQTIPIHFISVRLS